MVLTARIVSSGLDCKGPSIFSRHNNALFYFFWDGINKVLKRGILVSAMCKEHGLRLGLHASFWFVRDCVSRKEISIVRLIFFAIGFSVKDLSRFLGRIWMVLFIWVSGTQLSRSLLKLECNYSTMFYRNNVYSHEMKLYSRRYERSRRKRIFSASVQRWHRWTYPKQCLRGP